MERKAILVEGREGKKKKKKDWNAELASARIRKEIPLEKGNRGLQNSVKHSVE